MYSNLVSMVPPTPVTFLSHTCRSQFALLRRGRKQILMDPQHGARRCSGGIPFVSCPDAARRPHREHPTSSPCFLVSSGHVPDTEEPEVNSGRGSRCLWAWGSLPSAPGHTRAMAIGAGATATHPGPCRLALTSIPLWERTCCWWTNMKSLRQVSCLTLAFPHTARWLLGALWMANTCS